MESLKYHDGTTWRTVDCDLSQGIEVSDINEELEWQFTGIDDVPDTTVTDFIGGRPDDR